MGLKEIFIIAAVFHVSSQYKPIIFMHGIIGSPAEAEFITSVVQKIHPGTNITAIDAYNGIDSFTPMWEQVNNIAKIVKPIMDKSPQGVHLICFSQGGLVGRGLLSVLQHNIDTFIALSSPLAGQFGDTDYLRYLFPNYLKDTIYKYFYTKNGQKWSVADYWRDPHQVELYQKYSNYLYGLDNGQNSNPHQVELYQKYSNYLYGLDNGQNSSYKENFVRIKKLVLIGGPDDGVITPWQSSHFGFYDDKEKIQEMRQQQYYLKDSFGLKTLDERKAIDTYVIPGVQHVHWYRNMTVFTKYIQPYLT